jgi:dTDP-4-dehydrorhamnose reductase
MQRKLIILGSKGMLGQMVFKYFKNHNFEINVFDERFTDDNIERYIEKLNAFADSIIINCIGRIKQKSVLPSDLYLSNTLLPLALCRSLKKTHLLIHPSTDCVYDGTNKQPYLSYDHHTATDVYGISKSLGETAIISRPNSLIIRVSIIGPDENSNKGLLGWFLSQPSGISINGYSNHFWNGITTLEWCKKLHYFIDNPLVFHELLKKGILQLGTKQEYTKFQMLQIFQNIYKTNFFIEPFIAEYSVYRCLIPESFSNSLEMQINELYEYMS